MTRKKLREHLFVLLFRVDYYNAEDLAGQLQDYLEDMDNTSQAAKTEIDEKFKAVISHLPEIDAMIEKNAKGWDLKRLAKADITILRLAAYEIVYDASVPTGVAINEAIELAKAYSTEKASSFINGILATISKEYPEAEQ